MAQEDTIKVEVQRLINLAKRLAEAAQKLNGIVGDEYAGSLTELAKYWGGETATGLMVAGKKLGESMANVVKRIMETATALEKAAEEYARVEVKNKSGG